MFWYVGIIVSGLLAALGVVLRCKYNHKMSGNRKCTEYRKSKTSFETEIKEKQIEINKHDMSVEKEKSNTKIRLPSNSPFPILDELNKTKQADLIKTESSQNIDSAKILDVVFSKNRYFTKSMPNYDKIMTLSDTEDSNELYEVTTHHDDNVIHFSI